MDKSKYIEFTYGGIKYSSPYSLTLDSSLVIVDEEVEKIYKNLMSLPDLATLVTEDESVIFFDNEEELDSFLNSGKKLKSLSFVEYSITIYEHENYTGTSQYKMGTLNSSTSSSF